jgi:hypothetical protein
MLSLVAASNSEDSFPSVLMANHQLHMLTHDWLTGPFHPCYVALVWTRRKHHFVWLLDCSDSSDSLVSMVTRLLAGSPVFDSWYNKDFYLHHTIQTNSGAQAAPLSSGFFLQVKQLEREPVFMAWCLFKHSDNFYFSLFTGMSSVWARSLNVLHGKCSNISSSGVSHRLWHFILFVEQNKILFIIFYCCMLWN